MNKNNSVAFNELLEALPVNPSSVLRSRLRDFYDDYARCLDLYDLESWIDFFTEDCHYRVQSRENYEANLPIGFIYCMNKNMIRDRVTALRETTMHQPRTLRHFISGVHIESLENGLLKTRANFMITECMSDKDPLLLMVGEYIDEITLDDEGFRLSSRECVVDNYHIITSIIAPV